MFARRIKRLAHGGQWHARCLRLTQVIETSNRHIFRHAHAALLQCLQRAERHAVIRSHYSLKPKFTFVQQSVDCLAAAIGCVIAIYNQVFVIAQIMSRQFIFVGLKTLFGIHLSLNTTNKGDAFITMFFDQMPDRGTHPLHIIG